MVGGNQLSSRRKSLRKLLGSSISFEARLGEESVRGSCSLEFRFPDSGYFISGSDAQVHLDYIKGFTEEGVLIDLSNSGVRSLRRYEEALTQ